jgi:hypothetical protein
MTNKTEIGFMVFAIGIFAVIFYFFGDTHKAAIKYWAINVLKPFLSTTFATEIDRTIYQEAADVSIDGKKSINGRRPKESVPIYYTSIEFEFYCDSKKIKTYDSKVLYNTGRPAKRIESLVKKYGPNPVKFNLMDERFRMKEGIPWFILENTGKSDSPVDSAFTHLIEAQVFGKSTSKHEIHYLKWAPSFNDFEAHPPTLAFFWTESASFAAILLGLTILLRAIWYQAFKDAFHASPAVSILAWLAVVLLIFIVVPVRSRIESLEKQKYEKTVVINNEELKKMGLIP